MEKRLLTVVFLLMFGDLFAQQEAQFSQYMYNGVYYNPAYAGLERQPTFTLFHRTQWAGYQASFDDGGTPSTQVFSYNTPFPILGGGLAAHVVNDKLGPLSNLEAHLSYAYHIKLDNGGKLSVGGRGGLYSQTLDYGLYRPVDANDPLLQTATGRETEMKPDLAFGLYYISQKLKVGISATRLLENEFDFGDNLKNPLSRNVYLTGSYDIEINDQWVLRPSMLLKTDLNSISFDVTALAIYDQKFWGGLAYRQTDAATAILGMNILEDKHHLVRLKAGYSFDYTISGKQAKAPTSHEVFLAYSLPVPKKKSKSRQETPRFHF